MPTPLQLLLMPWWALTLATGAKSFRDHPLIGSQRLNEAGLHVARLKIAHSMAARRRSALASALAPDDLAQFNRDGFVIRRNFLPPQEFAALRTALQAWRGPAREMRQGQAITRRMALDPAILRALPALHAFEHNREWQALMRYGASFAIRPMAYVQTILAGGKNGEPDPQGTLHADAFQPSVKSWFFLDDVAEDEGPFTYVAGSNRLTPERVAWERAMSLRACDADRLSARGSFRIDAAELPALALPQPLAFAVPANTLVVADTFGFHARGGSARPSRRTEIFGYARRNPFLPWTGLDLGGIPGVAERRATAYWAFRDRFADRIGQPWQDAGIKGAFDR